MLSCVILSTMKMAMDPAASQKDRVTRWVDSLSSDAMNVFHRTVSTAFLLSLPLACPDPLLSSGEVSPEAADQRDYPDSPNGCAPATVLNLLRFGGEEFAPAHRALIGSSDAVRMRYLVDRYFRHRKSSLDPTRPRWGAHGVESEDLVEGNNELLAEHGIAPLKGCYLDRGANESESGHLLRVRGLIKDSVEAGVPPILSLRSFLVKRREENGGEPRWETGVSHFVLVVRVGDGASETGFELEVIDPWGGRRTALFVHREGNGQAFRALRGNEDSGEWLDGKPFLQVVAPGVPTLRPGHLDWSDRYLVVANHLTGRF